MGALTIDELEIFAGLYDKIKQSASEILHSRQQYFECITGVESASVTFAELGREQYEGYPEHVEFTVTFADLLAPDKAVAEAKAAQESAMRVIAEQREKALREQYERLKAEFEK